MTKNKRPLNRSVTIGCVVFIILLCLILSLVTIHNYSTSMYSQYETNMKNVLGYVYSHLDIDDLSECTRTLEQSETYKQEQQFFDDFISTYNVHYLYILKPLNTNPRDNVMCVLAANSVYDTESATNLDKEKFTLGDSGRDLYSAEVAAKYMEIMRNGELSFFEEVTEFGADYTGALPLIDSNGERFALLCVDVAVNDIHDTIRRSTIINIVLIVVLGVMFVAAFLYWLRMNITDPIRDLERSVSVFAASSHNHSDPSLLVFDAPDIHTHNEVESLSNAVNKMSIDMRNYVTGLLDAEHRVENMKTQVEEMDELAHTDALTGVFNKMAYEEMVAELDEDIKAKKAEFAIIMIDLNFLKKINDTYGHENGNSMIIAASKLICDKMKKSPVYRIGGDEFVCVIKGDSYDWRNRMYARLEEAFKRLSADETLQPWERLSAAMGIADYEPGKDADAEAVFKRADKLMYKHKVEMKAQRI